MSAEDSEGCQPPPLLATCTAYTVDFCAPSATARTCTSVCTTRNSNGTCTSYGADLCQ